MFRCATVVLIVFNSSLTCCAGESPFLANMPQNSDQRCVGIAGVAEALLEGNRQDAKLTNVDDLARTVYEGFTAAEPIAYPARVMLKGKGIATDDPASLLALSTRVADLYKADYHRLSASPAGLRQLAEAETEVIKSRNELEVLVAADPDRTMFFCCFGQRTFPDGTVKDTSHAVLIHFTPAGKLAIYDPNDPGKSISCELEDTADGLVASWRCRYRDQNVQTTQRYQVVPQYRYFKAIKAPVPGQYSLIRQSRQTRPGAITDAKKCDCEKQ